MNNEKFGFIKPEPESEKAPFHKGDVVTHPDLGNGVVVGFSSISGEPHVFFYSRQKVLCLGKEGLSRI